MFFNLDINHLGQINILLLTKIFIIFFDKCKNTSTGRIYKFTKDYFLITLIKYELI